MIHKVDLEEKLALFSEQWTPKIVGDVDDYHVKLAKIQGELVWHSHDHEDEMFLVIKGQLRLKLRDGEITVNPGEFTVVPKGVEHLPIADDETHLLLFEKSTTKHTGDVRTDRTVDEPERI